MTHRRYFRHKNVSHTRKKFELLIKRKILLLHISSTQVHGNLNLFYVHGNSCTVDICAAGIITKINRKLYLMEKYKLITILISCKPFIIST